MQNLALPLNRNFFLYTLLFLFGATSAFGQTSKIDKLLPQLNQKLSDTTRLRILRELTGAYGSVDQQKKYEYANSYKKLAKKLKNDTLVIEADIDIGGSFAIQSKMDSALFYFSKGYLAAKKSNYKTGIARSLASTGFVYDKIDKETQAIENYEEALQIYKSINHKKGINQCLINIGGIYYDLTEYKLAKSYFQQSYESNKAIGNDAGTGSALFSLGGASKRLGEPDKAYDYYKQSLEIREKIGDLNGIALSRWGLGTIDNERGHYKKALKNLEIALKYDIDLKNTYHESAVLLSIAVSYLGLKDFKKAFQYVDRAYENGKIIDSKNVRLEALKVYIQISEKRKDFKNAFKYQEHYMALLDSAETEKVTKHVMTTDYNRVRNENEGLLKDNQVIVDKNQEYLKTIAAISTLSFLLVVLLVLIFKRYKEKKEVNKLLIAQKEEIAQINSELEVLNEEVTNQMELTASQNLELEQLNRVKNKFFSIVSHDLRNPLANLKMLFKLYRDGHLTENELSDLLSKLEETIFTTAAFLDNLLEWSKSQLDGIVVKPAYFKVNEIVTENIQMIDSQIRMKGILVKNNVPETLQAYADSNMINVVVRNLISNGIKFCKSGDTISIDAHEKESKIILTIKDCGPGMSDEILKNLFNLQHSVSLGTSGEKGHQIGLILCKDMIEQNKGTISVESKIGAGTTFIVTIPSKEK